MTIPQASKALLPVLFLASLLVMFVVLYVKEVTTITIPKLGFEAFTGLSLFTTSGASGKRFEGKKCRTMKGIWSLQQWPKQEAILPPMSSQARNCAKWIVVTTINPPTPAIRMFDQLESWCTVIVFDTKTPAEAYSKIQRAELLTVERQKEFIQTLGLKSLELIPWKHFGRKNVGFLFAIIHGAQEIYDTDDDNVLIRNISLDEKAVGLGSSGSVVNIYQLFKNTSMANEVWPRGFPLEEIHSKHETKCCQFSTGDAKIGVRQYLAQNDPDVDAIYRLTAPLPFNFRTDVSGYVLAPNIYVPYNAQATLHSYEAFFGLLLPISVHGRVSDIWRSYFVQKLLWLSGQRLAFFPPLVVQERNVHNYLADFDSEIPLYIKTGQLVNYLSSWIPSTQNVRDSVLELAIDLYQHCYWEEEDVRLVKAWLDDLTRAGYNFPNFTTTTDHLDCLDVDCGIQSS